MSHDDTDLEQMREFARALFANANANAEETTATEGATPPGNHVPNEGQTPTGNTTDQDLREFARQLFNTHR